MIERFGWGWRHDFWEKLLGEAYENQWMGGVWVILVTDTFAFMYAIYGIVCTVLVPPSNAPFKHEREKWNGGMNQNTI